ncbi:MAG: AMP-binding protein [Anaerolineales bacterium]
MSQTDLHISGGPVPMTLDPQLDTIAKQFVASAQKYGRQHIAMRKKRYGIWQEYTWEDSLNIVRDFANALLSFEFERGSKIAIIGENDPEYYWAEYGAHCAGHVAVGMFTDAAVREVEFLINNCDAVIVVAHDQEQCDKLLELRDNGDAPNVQGVVYWDARGLWNYDDPWLVSFEEFCKIGREYGEKNPQAFEQAVAAGNADDIALFSYTSGTTGLPKAAMITHANLLYGNIHAGTIQPLDVGDDYVSFSPLAWIAEQGFGITGHVRMGATVNFPEKPETVQTDIRDIAPRSLLFPSRLWESLVSQVQARMADSHPSNRFLYNLFLPIGYKIADLADQRQTPSLWWRFLYFLGDMALFAPLRDKLGLRRIRYAYTGGAALSPDVLRFFRALDIELLQLYGSTECQTHTLHYVGDVRLGTVGKPPPGVEVQVTDEGEIAVKSRSVFVGYYKAQEKYNEAVRNGWFYTGDAGYVDDNGHLIYLDRMSDMIELASGEKFSPQYIEGRTKFNPYVQDVMAVGGFDMPYVSALITINYDNVARWAEKRGIAFTTIVDLSQKPEVYDLIEQDIARVNGSLPPMSRVRRFVILNKAFDADEAELTRTRKLRRRYLEQRYGDILSAIYQGKDTVMIQSEVTYQDGRTVSNDVLLNIRNVGDASDLPVVETRPEALAQKTS